MLAWEEVEGTSQQWVVARGTFLVASNNSIPGQRQKQMRTLTQQVQNVVGFYSENVWDTSWQQTY